MEGWGIRACQGLLYCGMYVCGVEGGKRPGRQEEEDWQVVVVVDAIAGESGREIVTLVPVIQYRTVGSARKGMYLPTVRIVRDT